MQVYCGSRSVAFRVDKLGRLLAVTQGS